MPILSKHMPEEKVIRDRYAICPCCDYFSHSAEHVAYCILCGAKMSIECAECLEPILYPTAKYCPSCGVPYHLPAATANAADLKKIHAESVTRQRVA